MEQAPQIVLRAARASDRALLECIYASTRAGELDAVPWCADAKRAFLASQFAVQDANYRRSHPHASFDLILLGGESVGRLYVDRAADEIRIIDIALLPRARGTGIATRLIEQLQREASASGAAISLHVERHNRARALYRRLGFDVISADDVYLLMRWAPSGVESDQPNTAS